MIKTFKEDYHTTVLSNFGFRIMLHNSYDFADDNSETKLINSNMEAFISIAPGNSVREAILSKIHIPFFL